MPHTKGRDTQRELLSLLTARVRDAYIRKPFYVDGGLDLVSVCRELAAQGLTHALVHDAHDGVDRLGMFTTTDLRDALLRDVPPGELAVRDVARFGLVEIDADAEMFEALWLMVRHRVHRVLVRDAGEVLGVLGQIDLVSFVANHSHLVAIQIDDAHTVADLAAAARRVDEMVGLLHDSGIKIERITRLVSELNSRLFSRLWAMLAPADLVANSCLVVMGSEGRGEQILKTDQDNALLLRDGFACADLEGIAQRFNAALAELGYPPCPGNIMLTNPLWRQPLAAFRETIRTWVYGDAAGPDPEGTMNLAIFFDAAAVAGDARLLDQARSYLDGIVADSDAFLARFARAADQFAEPGGHWWTRLTTRRDEQPLDLKKLGTFPIVHGVRALALKHRVRERGTVARLAVLVERDLVAPALARDLTDALHFLMGLRLRHQLRQRAGGAAASNLVLPSALATLERDQFLEALGIVKGFRQFLQQHFRLDSL